MKGALAFRQNAINQLGGMGDFTLLVNGFERAGVPAPKLSGLTDMLGKWHVPDDGLVKNPINRSVAKEVKQAGKRADNAVKFTLGQTIEHGEILTKLHSRERSYRKIQAVYKAYKGVGGDWASLTRPGTNGVSPVAIPTGADHVSLEQVKVVRDWARQLSE